MYISEFVCGVIVGVIATFVVCIAWGSAQEGKTGKKE